MNKSEAVRIISKCANIYKKRLDGYQIVFVYRDEKQSFQLYGSKIPFL